MAKFNPGKFVGNEYIKKVKFSEAVLWHTREISLRASITSQFKEKGTEWVIFEDDGKKERWTASVEELRKVARHKTEGQEPQFYFPIDAFKKEKYDEPAKLAL